MHTRAQGAAAELAGADAILVGSTLMRATIPASSSQELLSRPLVKVCGLTRDEDVAAAVEAGADLLGFILVPESPRAAARVLEVPDECSPSRFGSARPARPTRPRPGARARAGKVRGRDAVILRDGEEVAPLLDLPWEEDDPAHWERAAATPGGRPRGQARG